MIVGDFNVKVGEEIKGNHKTISIGDKILNKMIKNENFFYSIAAKNVKVYGHE